MLDFTNTASLLGYYGDEIPDQIRKLASHDVFIDIGANTGVFSLVACDIVKDGFVFAFEPIPIWQQIFLQTQSRFRARR